MRENNKELSSENSTVSTYESDDEVVTTTKISFMTNLLTFTKWVAVFGIAAILLLDNYYLTIWFV